MGNADVGREEPHRSDTDGREAPHRAGTDVEREAPQFAGTAAVPAECTAPAAPGTDCLTAACSEYQG